MPALSSNARLLSLVVPQPDWGFLSFQLREAKFNASSSVLYKPMENLWCLVLLFYNFDITLDSIDDIPNLLAISPAAVATFNY